MKKFLLFITLVLLSFACVACGAPDETTADSKHDDATENPIVDETTTPSADTPIDDEPSDGTPDEVGNGRHVMALLMDHERTVAYSGAYGTWGNSGKDLKHQPDKVKEDGLRDIASVYYPSIGLYDVSDPDYQEYMMQLCKMSYIDTLNYYLSTASEIEEGKWWGDNFRNNVLPMLRKYGLNATARLEKPINSMASADDTETIKKALTNIVNMLDDRVLKINDRPVLAQFTKEGLDPQTVEDWKIEYRSEHGTVPFFMITDYAHNMKGDWTSAVDGYFGWVEIDHGHPITIEYAENYGDYRKYATAEQAENNHDTLINHIKGLLQNGDISFYSESLCPGFDDIEVWGWSTVPRKIERGNDCELYIYKWQSAIENGFPMVNIPTWDDWGESTTIEPTLEYGVDFLEVTRKYAAEYKGIEANTASLELPGWIYKIRKTTDDAAILAVMDEASNLIAESRYDEAEALVKPYVTSLNIPETSKEFFDYPNTPTTPLIPEDDGEESVPVVNGDTEIYTAVADTYVVSGGAKNIDTGTETKMRVKNAYATNLSRNAYVKFNTSATTFEGVSKATLRLYCTWSSTSQTEIEGRKVKLYATVTDWYEGTFSWKSQPLVIEKVADVDTFNYSTNQWVEIDVTEYVKYNLGNKISFSLRNEGTDSEENHLDFATRETGEHAPQLIIERGEPAEAKPEIKVKETVLTAVADTYVTSGSTGGDGGSEKVVRMKKADIYGRTRHTFFKFDTTSVDDSQVLKATLKLHCNYASSKLENVNTRYITVYATSTEWSENSFNWSTQPTTTEKIVTYVDTSSYNSDMWVEIDITEYVKAHAGEVISISLWDEGEDNDQGHIDFTSREVAGFEPKLVISSD